MGPGTAKVLLFQDAKVISKIAPGAMLYPVQLNVTWLGVKLAAACPALLKQGKPFPAAPLVQLKKFGPLKASPAPAGAAAPLPA
jgi:hypothetical protein